MPTPSDSLAIDPADALEISFMKARYCRFIDRKQWARLPELFTPDAIFDGFGAAPRGASLDTFVRGVAGRLEGAITVHRCCMPDMVPTSPETVRVVWSMTDYNEWPQPIDLPGTSEAYGFRGYGYYEEEYRRDGRGWRIAYMRLVRLRMDPIREVDRRLTANSMNTDWWLAPDDSWLAP